MLASYDRYMREFRLKRLQAQLERDDAPDTSEIVPSVHVALIATRAAVKHTMRNMEGHA